MGDKASYRREVAAGIKYLTVRMDSETKAQIVERAQANGNSINQQILLWIEWGIETGYGEPPTALSQGQVRDH